MDSKWMNGRTGGRMYSWTKGGTDGQSDVRMSGRVAGRTCRIRGRSTTLASSSAAWRTAY